MRKLVVVTTFLILAVAASSCKKKTDCVCAVGGVTLNTYPNYSASDCAKMEADINSGYGSSVVSCSLK